MKAKLVGESLTISPIKFGYYTMANALDIMKTAVPALREAGIHFSYDGYSNFLKVNAKNIEEAKIAEDIIINISEGDIDENHDTENSDAAEIIILK
jgi:tRNA A58 N-methylase Trm61